MKKTVMVELDREQLTIIRVACLLRLDRLKDRGDEYGWAGYIKTRAMMESPDGVLYKAMRELYSVGPREVK